MTEEDLRKIAIAMLIPQEWRRKQIEEEYLNEIDKEILAWTYKIIQQMKKSML